MLHDQDLSAYLLKGATSTTMYIHNRSPHAVLDEKTHEEVFTGEKPDISHIWIFGSPVYIHIPKEKKNQDGTF